MVFLKRNKGKRPKLDKTSIIENIPDKQDVVDRLIAGRVLTGRMMAKVLAKATPETQIMKFLSKADNSAYECFYLIMLGTNNEVVADILKPEMKSRHAFKRPAHGEINRATAQRTSNGRDTSSYLNDRTAQNKSEKCSRTSRDPFTLEAHVPAFENTRTNQHDVRTTQELYPKAEPFDETDIHQLFGRTERVDPGGAVYDESEEVNEEHSQEGDHGETSGVTDRTDVETAQEEPSGYQENVEVESRILQNAVHLDVDSILSDSTRRNESVDTMSTNARQMSQTAVKMRTYEGCSNGYDQGNDGEQTNAKQIATTLSQTATAPNEQGIVDLTGVEKKIRGRGQCEITENNDGNEPVTFNVCEERCIANADNTHGNTELNTISTSKIHDTIVNGSGSMVAHCNDKRHSAGNGRCASPVENGVANETIRTDDDMTGTNADNSKRNAFSQTNEDMDTALLRRTSWSDVENTTSDEPGNMEEIIPYQPSASPPVTCETHKLNGAYWEYSEEEHKEEFIFVIKGDTNHEKDTEISPKERDQDNVQVNNKIEGNNDEHKLAASPAADYEKDDDNSDVNVISDADVVTSAVTADDNDGDDSDDNNEILYDAFGTPMVDPCVLEYKVTKHLKESDMQTGETDDNRHCRENDDRTFWGPNPTLSTSELDPRFKTDEKENIQTGSPFPNEKTCTSLPPRQKDVTAPISRETDVLRRDVLDMEPDFRLTVSGRSVSQNIKVWGAIELSLVPNGSEHHGNDIPRQLPLDNETDQRFPSDWPSVSAMTAPIRVTPCSVRSELVKTLWQLPNVYTLKKRTRGKCLIISNQYFYGPVETSKAGITRCILPTRHGTDKDVQDLTSLFRQLHFEVAVERDCTAQQMQEILSVEASRPSHETAECFICVVCSHGSRPGIFGVDGDVITLEQVTEYFDSTRCPQLQGKPKLFFIQACAGDTRDTLGNAMPSGSFGANIFDSAPEMEICDDFTPANEPLVNRLQLTPAMADMLVACATHPGYLSIRNTTYGSWFLQAVVCVFQKYAYEESIQDLLVMVNQLVASGRAYLHDPNGDNGPTMQVSKFESSLTKKFFFFPGLVEGPGCE